MRGLARRITTGLLALGIPLAACAQTAPPASSAPPTSASAAREPMPRVGPTATPTPATPLTPLPPVAPPRSIAPPKVSLPALSGRAPTSPPRDAAPALPDQLPDHLPGEILLAWTQVPTLSESALWRSSGLQPQELTRQAWEHLGMTVWRLRFETEAQAQQFLDWARAHLPEVRADRNWRYDALGGARLYGQQQIGLPCTQPSSTAPPPAGLRNQRIGMLDTAVADIPALSGSRLIQRRFTDADRPAPPHHGTAVAAAMAGQLPTAGYCSPAAGATLVVANVMREGPAGQVHTHTSNVVSALDWVLGQKVSAINLSLGGPGDLLMQLAVERAHQQGTPLVAAAGNQGPTAPPVYPAAYPGVIAVTALDAAQRPYAAAATGRHVLVAAPGVEVWLPDEQGGRYETGTSFAAPLVTAAVVRAQAQGALRHTNASAWLCAHAQDLGPPGRDPVYGCGALRWPPPSSAKKH